MAHTRAGGPFISGTVSSPESTQKKDTIDTTLGELQRYDRFRIKRGQIEAEFVIGYLFGNSDIEFIIRVDGPQPGCAYQRGTWDVNMPVTKIIPKGI